MKFLLNTWQLQAWWRPRVSTGPTRVFTVAFTISFLSVCLSLSCSPSFSLLRPYFSLSLYLCPFSPPSLSILFSPFIISFLIQFFIHTEILSRVPLWSNDWQVWILVAGGSFFLHSDVGVSTVSRQLSLHHQEAPRLGWVGSCMESNWIPRRSAGLQLTTSLQQAIALLSYSLASHKVLMSCHHIFINTSGAGFTFL